jgi:hypothetical protein
MVIARYAGQYILLQDDGVLWHEPHGHLRMSRRKLAGGQRDHAMWFKYVDSGEAEGEHYEVYERLLERIQEIRSEQ